MREKEGTFYPRIVFYVCVNPPIQGSIFSLFMSEKPQNLAAFPLLPWDEKKKIAQEE